MIEGLYNSEGVPLVHFGRNHFAITKGSPDQRPAVSKQTEVIEDKTTVGSYTTVAWGANNDFPDTALKTIGKIGVLNTGLKFIRNFTIGQGIFPCNVTGYTDDGNEILKVVDDKEVISFLNSRMVRRYLEKATRDYLKFGRANAQLLLNEDKSQMVGINTLNTIFCRDTLAEKGLIKKLIVSGKFPDNPGDGEFEAYDMLDEYDPIGNLDLLKLTGNMADSYIFPIRDSWSNYEYYSEPIWLSSYNAGWTEIATLVPLFLKKMFENAITLKWHIQIPYAYWDKKFPLAEYPNAKTRKTAIEAFMDEIEDNLTKPENAGKAIFSFFEMNPNGKAEEQWVITALDGKTQSKENLITSAAANSEILFSMMINPNVLGAGMPGGTYAGNQGGSNIREAYLVNIANAWIDRQTLLDPLEAYLHFNGKTDIELRFRSTILTTLDTGAGTTKKLS